MMSKVFENPNPEKTCPFVRKAILVDWEDTFLYFWCCDRFHTNCYSVSARGWCLGNCNMEVKA